MFSRTSRSWLYGALVRLDCRLASTARSNDPRGCRGGPGRTAASAKRRKDWRAGLNLLDLPGGTYRRPAAGALSLIPKREGRHQHCHRVEDNDERGQLPETPRHIDDSQTSHPCALHDSAHVCSRWRGSGRIIKRTHAGLYEAKTAGRDRPTTRGETPASARCCTARRHPLGEALARSLGGFACKRNRAHRQAIVFSLWASSPAIWHQSTHPGPSRKSRASRRVFGVA